MKEEVLKIMEKTRQLRLARQYHHLLKERTELLKDFLYREFAINGTEPLPAFFPPLRDLFSLHPIKRTHRERKRILKKGIGQSGQTEKKRRVNKDSTWWPSRVSVLEIYYILALLQRQVETLQTIGWTKQTTYNHNRLYLRTTFLQLTSLWTVHVRNVGCSPSPFLWSLGCRNLQVWCDMIF